MGRQSRLKWERWFERRWEALQAASLSGAFSQTTERIPRSIFSDRAKSLIGLFLSLLSVGGQALFPTLYSIWVVCFAIGISGIVFALLSERVCGRFLAANKTLRLTLSGLVFVGATIFGWDRARQLAELPDVDLIFVYPTDVSPYMVNSTDKVVQQPKYQVTLWNLDHHEKRNPLPIPTQTGDFIRPHNAWGPNEMLGLPAVRPLVSVGDHLFGFAQALCPDCKRNHYYWVYIEHGKLGWYCELPSGQLININVLFQKIVEIANARDTWINEVAPPACRTPVKQLK